MTDKERKKIKKKEIDCGKFKIIITNKTKENIDTGKMSPYYSPLYERILQNSSKKTPTPKKLEFDDEEL